MDLFIINLDLTRNGTDAAVETKQKTRKKKGKTHSSLLYKHEFGFMENFIILLRTRDKRKCKVQL